MTTWTAVNEVEFRPTRWMPFNPYRRCNADDPAAGTLV